MLEGSGAHRRREHDGVCPVNTGPTNTRPINTRRMNNAAPEMHDHPARTPVLRWLSGTMALPGLCAHAACRRAGDCHGEPRDCLSRYAPLVPEEARDGMQALVEAKFDNIAFEQLMEEAPDE